MCNHELVEDSKGKCFHNPGILKDFYQHDTMARNTKGKILKHLTNKMRI